MSIGTDCHHGGMADKCQSYSSIITPIPGKYNGVFGRVSTDINFSSKPPPTVRTYLPKYSDQMMKTLAKKMDVLEPVGLKIYPSSDSLDDRIKALESRMKSLETLCIARSGMKRHCLPPTALNGSAK